MVKIFGVDFPTVIQQYIGNELPTAFLVKVTNAGQDAGDVTGTPNPNEQRFECNAIAETQRQRFEDQEGPVGESRRFLVIAKRLLVRRVRPEVGDFIEIDEGDGFGLERFRIAEIPDRDPGGATYLCRVES